jgi:hypothetical protein
MPLTKAVWFMFSYVLEEYDLFLYPTESAACT